MESTNQSTVESATRPGLIARVMTVFTAPTKAFAALTRKTDWIAALVIIAILGGIVGHLTRPIIVRDMLPAAEERLEQYRQYMSQAQYDEAMNRIAQARAEAEVNKFEWYFPLIVLGFPFIVMVIISALGLISGNFIFGGKANFWIIMNAVAFAALIGLFGDIVRGLMMLAKDSAQVFTGLGLLRPVNDGSFIFYLFRQIDIFSIWRIVATAIGLGIVYNMKPKKFAYVLFIVWIILIVLVAVANQFTGGSIVY